jgi:hypothetical protein
MQGSVARRACTSSQRWKKRRIPRGKQGKEEEEDEEEEEEEVQRQKRRGGGQGVRERTRAHGVSVKREKVTLADWPKRFVVPDPRPTSSPALAQSGALETLVCDSAEHTLEQ